MKNFFELYNIDKNGLINGTNKQCICGTNTTENVCPHCGADLKKSKLLNVAKNTALAKRNTDTRNGNKLIYQSIHLMSIGFELYEQVMMEVTIDLDTEEVKISNGTMFKKQSDDAGVFNFINKHLPGYLDMTQEAIDTASGSMVRHITALTESQLANMLHVYLNYRAVFPYLIRYKALYYGNLLNLKKYYPDVDFNDINSVKSCKLNLYLLAFWDMKNAKYIEAIIDISQKEEIQPALTAMLIECIKELNVLLRSWDFDGNSAIDTFSLLFNREISVEDFIRIFNRTRPEDFFALKRYKVRYKKLYRKEIDWTTFKGLNRKERATMALKDTLKAQKMSTEKIDEIFQTLDSSPLDALKMLLD